MTLMIPFPDRIHAGEALAERLAQEGDWTDALVLALPRGGVPVAFEKAEDRRNFICAFLDFCARALRQHTRNIFIKSAAGNVGNTLHTHGTRERI